MAAQPDEIDKFHAANRAVQDHKRTIFQKISLFQPGMGLLTQINLAVLLGYGGYLVVHGELRLGEGLFVFANLLPSSPTRSARSRTSPTAFKPA